MWIGWMRLVLDDVHLGFCYQQSLTFAFTANDLTSQSVSYSFCAYTFLTIFLFSKINVVL
jgi:hypothetical protein